MAFAAPAGTELVERIGAGTTFDVAVVREGGELVICKRLNSRVLREPAGHAAMAREVGLLRVARHPVLPELVRAGDDEHGPFAIERRVAGVSLAAGAEGLRARLGAVPGEVVARVAASAAGALADLHELEDAGGSLAIVHGDLTPDHVRRAPGDASASADAIAFVDFGAARFRGMEPGLAGDDRGTLPFVAPEVARGEVAPAQAHDVYALAAALVAFGSGRPLATATHEAAMLLEVGERGVRLDGIDAVPGLDAAGRGALRAALAFEPKNRLGSARGLAEALRHRVLRR